MYTRPVSNHWNEQDVDVLLCALIIRLVARPHIPMVGTVAAAHEEFTW